MDHKNTGGVTRLFEFHGKIDYFEFFIFKVFPGNNDRYTPVGKDLKYPIITRYIRVHPESWHKRIAMRAEFYGCIKGEN